MKLAATAVLLGAAVALLAHDRSSAEVPRIPDLKEGVIDGVDAIGFWPADMTRGYSIDAVVPADDIEAHLIDRNDLDREAVFPAGQWIKPPPGSYRLFLEGAGWISPTLGQFAYSGQRTTGRGTSAILPVVPAGRVLVHTGDRPLDGGLSVRLLHLDSHLRQEPYIQREMSRRASSQRAAAGIAMPEGEILAMVFEEASGEYVFVSRPIRVDRGRAAVVEAGTSATNEGVLLAVLQRATLTSKREEDGVRLSWFPEGGGEPVSPDVSIPTASFVYGVWYGLLGAGRLEAEGPGVRFESPRQALLPGQVHRIAGQLSPNPD